MIENEQDFADLMAALRLIQGVTHRIEKRLDVEGTHALNLQRLAVAYQGIERVAFEFQPKPPPVPDLPLVPIARGSHAAFGDQIVPVVGGYLRALPEPRRLAEWVFQNECSAITEPELRAVLARFNVRPARTAYCTGHLECDPGCDSCVSAAEMIWAAEQLARLGAS